MPRTKGSRPATRRPRQTPATPVAKGGRPLQLLIGFVAIVLFVTALAGENGFIDTLRAQRQYRDLGSAVARLERENAALRAEASRLREDPQAIEEIARRDLGLIRPGELLFIIKDVERLAAADE